MISFNVLLVITSFLCASLQAVGALETHVELAVANFTVTGDINGQITFYQPYYPGPVNVTGSIQGLTVTHGLHVLQDGKCDGLSPHFNPYNRDHGKQTSVYRHAGDLGNINETTFNFADLYLSLNGPLSVLGRSLAITAKSDDGGLGNTSESLKNGNSGAQTACAVIAVTKDSDPR